MILLLATATPDVISDVKQAKGLEELRIIITCLSKSV